MGSYHETAFTGARKLAISHSFCTKAVLRHELSHYFLGLKSNTRVWFNEGLAEYLRFESEDESLASIYLDYLTENAHKPGFKQDLKNIVHISPRSFYRKNFSSYAISWMLVYTLIEMNEDITVANFKDYQQFAEKLLSKQTSETLIKNMSEDFYTKNPRNPKRK